MKILFCLEAVDAFETVPALICSKTPLTPTSLYVRLRHIAGVCPFFFFFFFLFLFFFSFVRISAVDNDDDYR